MSRSIEFSVIVETYNLHEGTDPDRFWAVLSAATAMIPEDGSAEVLITDVSASREVERILSKKFPQVRRVAATGLGYDTAKAMGAKASTGRYLLFLDGDCIPDPGWHLRLLEVLRSGRTAVCGGYTRYEGGFLAALMSVMDFGFFYPRIVRGLKCYASNNAGFLREAFEAFPMSQSHIRCSCYRHAQHLLRRGTPIQLVPEARVLHGMLSIIRVRSKQGYDAIAACWVDPELPESRLLRLVGILSIPFFYVREVSLDWMRVWIGRKDLKLSPWQVILSLLLFPLFRVIDVAGMIRAFIYGPTQGGWGGF